MNEEQIFKEFRIQRISADNLLGYVQLLKVCFPKFEVSPEYLQWLYFQNPLGYVLGFDAILDTKIVAHYACIPMQVSGIPSLVLLSLNSATLPDFQGRGLFRVLAEKTYSSAEELGYSAVVGVANAKSLRSFTRHLGFSYLGDLDLRFGSLGRAKLGSRSYSGDDLIWRCNSPLNQFSWKMQENGSVKISARVSKLLKLVSIIPGLNPSKRLWQKYRFGLTLDWRKGRKPFLFLPKRLKPSPLALIYKSLDGTPPSVLTSWSFPDFDAF
jgi:GNAT superfamily N-acetyltransferase